MSKIFVQNMNEVLRYSGSLTGVAAGIGGSAAGSAFCKGNSRLVGTLYLSASLQSASGLQVWQSADGGSNWDVKSACITLAAGASTFEYDLRGDAVKVYISNGSSTNTVRTLWQVVPI